MELAAVHKATAVIIPTMQPWFSHQLNQPTQDDIEARICTVRPFEGSSVLVDLLELYIQ